MVRKLALALALMLCIGACAQLGALADAAPTRPSDLPIYYSYHTSNHVGAGSPVTFTVTTSANATFARVLDASGRTLVDISEYSDDGGRRIFEGTHTFASPGTYSVKLYAGNDAGLSIAFGAKRIVILSASVTPSPRRPSYVGYSTTNHVPEGWPVYFRVLTSQNATFARVADDKGFPLLDLTEYTDEGGQRTFVGEYAFDAQGEYVVRLYAGNDEGLSDAFGTKTLFIEAPAPSPTPRPTPLRRALYHGFKTGNALPAGMPVPFSVETSEEASFARVTDENGETLVDLTEYTDADGTRTFTGSYAFLKGGTYGVRMYAGNDVGLSIAFGSKQITVLDSDKPMFYGYQTQNNLTAGEPVAMRITTSEDAAFARVTDATGNVLEEFTEYADAEGGRTFEGSHVFEYPGAYAVRMYAGSDAGVSDNSGEKTITVIALPGAPVYYEHECGDTVAVDKKLEIRVSAGEDAQRIVIVDAQDVVRGELESGKLESGESEDDAEDGARRVFTGSITFKDAGEYALRVYAWGENGYSETYGVANVTVTAKKKK